MGGSLNALELSHRFISEHVRQGNFCIDATAGRGQDTVFLCRLVGDSGRVLAFDIQEEALESTRKRLLSEKLDRCSLILDNHANMATYAEPDTVDCIVFNFGWLPGGNHSVFTRPESSISAIKAGISLLRVGGIMSLCIYYGRDCGFEERDAILAFLPTLDYQRFTVITAHFCNRPNNPPMPVFILRDS